MKEYLVGEVVNIWWTLDSLDALCLQTSSKKGTRDWCADDLVSEETMAKVSTVNSSRTFADNTCYLVIILHKFFSACRCIALTAIVKIRIGSPKNDLE